MIKPNKDNSNPFDAREAAKAIFEVMKRMGLDMSNKPGKQHWFGSFDDWTKEKAKISLGNNFIFIKVCEKGFSISSSHAMFGGYSSYSKSYEEFKKSMQHVLWHYGTPEYINGRKNPEYQKYKKYLK